MIGTIQAMNWSLNLKDMNPDAKLLAIYIASRAGQSRLVTINDQTASEWCGFLSPARKQFSRSRFVGALQAIPGINYVYADNGEVAITLGAVA